jgi:cytochrome c-type biogenesis protein CcmH
VTHDYSGPPMQNLSGVLKPVALPTEPRRPILRLPTSVNRRMSVKGISADVLLWSFIALLTAAAIFAVLVPLGRAPAEADAAGHARRVYLDQLKELERDKEQGRISAMEAEAARAEIARRLIAVDESRAVSGKAVGNPTVRRATALGALLGIPLLSLSLYLGLGTPNLPGQPLAARLGQLAEPGDIEALVAVEEHLARQPEDGRGWEVIAPVYLHLGRDEDAERAYRNAIRLLGSTAPRQTGLGEAIVGAEGGIVTAAARAAFEAAAALDPSAPGPRFFLALAAEQDGDLANAAAGWSALLADTPPDAFWRAAVEEALARIVPTGGTGGPAQEQLAEVGDMSADDPDAMIESMVSGLQERLGREPDDVEGWLRLIRSYMVLGRERDAAATAQAALRGVAQASDRQRVDALIADLGLASGEGGTP